MDAKEHFGYWAKINAAMKESFIEQANPKTIT
jgi:hypothetical protein